MRLIVATALVLVCGLLLLDSTATPQITIDPALRVAAVIRPSDVPG